MQIDSIVMGSPLGAAMANILVGFQKAKLFEIIYKLLYFAQYIDETFMYSSRS